MTDYVIKNGKAYPIVKPKAQKSTKPKKSLDQNLKESVAWFKANGHRPLGTATKGKYTRKNGKQIDVFKLNVALKSGGTKQYNVSANRIWAVA